jgi:hypothetical protein
LSIPEGLNQQAFCETLSLPILSDHARQTTRQQLFSQKLNSPAHLSEETWQSIGLLNRLLKRLLKTSVQNACSNVYSKTPAQVQLQNRPSRRHNSIPPKMHDVFAVPIFFIVFRETVETGIVISVLLSFLSSHWDPVRMWCCTRS